MNDVITFGNGQWLTCKTCHHPLVPVSVVQGVTVLIMAPIVIYKAAVVCGKCGTSRDFLSAPADGPADQPDLTPVAAPTK